jgi:L-alanine-DL-glutamate epimerase-like enolase superfamily enzyme
MGKRTVNVRVERFATAQAFVIARGSKTHVDVAVAEVSEDGATGRGEATAIYYLGETAEGLADQIRAAAPLIEDGAGRDDLLRQLPAGGARKALDCALWDLEAKLAGRPVWRLIGLPAPKPLLTAYTISLGEPADMEAAARAANGYGLLKLKLSGDGDEARVAAVRRGAPHARLIIDANEAWAGQDIEAKAAAMHALGVELIEQPVPAGQDHLLDGIRSPVPLCADETIHDRTTLGEAVGRYALINIKLDKTGGLTEALALAGAARERGLDLMTGCMLSTSLGVAPAFYVGMQSRFVDLDGPLLLARDREPRIRFDGSEMHPPNPELWG